MKRRAKTDKELEIITQICSKLAKRGFASTSSRHDDYIDLKDSEDNFYYLRYCGVTRNNNSPHYNSKDKRFKEKKIPGAFDYLLIAIVEKIGGVEEIIRVKKEIAEANLKRRPSDRKFRLRLNEIIHLGEILYQGPDLKNRIPPKLGVDTTEGSAKRVSQRKLRDEEGIIKTKSFELAGQSWPILIASANAGKTIIYQELAENLGYKTARICRFALSPIQDFVNEKKLPLLTSIVVNKTTRIPGSGFLRGATTLEDAQRTVFDFDWSGVKQPFAQEFQNQIVNPNEFRVPDLDVVVNGRGPYQRRFRIILMRAYNSCCALCETRYPEMLVASHIIPWAEDMENRLNPRNGLLLCRTHDSAFENGIIVIAADGSVNTPFSDRRKLGRHLHNYLYNSSSKLRKVPSKYSPYEFLERRALSAKA